MSSIDPVWRIARELAGRSLDRAAKRIRNWRRLETIVTEFSEIMFGFLFRS
jgi:hypothetical protein